MDINFAPPAEFVELAEKTKAFVIDKVIPYETDPRWTSHGPTDELRRELNDYLDESVEHLPRGSASRLVPRRSARRDLSDRTASGPRTPTRRVENL